MALNDQNQILLKAMQDLIKDNNKTMADTITTQVNASVEAINAGVDVKFDKLRKDMSANQEEITKQLSKLSDRVTAVETRTSEACEEPGSKRPFRNSSVPRTAAGAPASSSAPPPTTTTSSSKDGNPSNPYKIWVKGFPRGVPKTLINRTAEQLIDLAHPQSKGNYKTSSQPVDKQFTITFPTSAAASDFLANARVKTLSFPDPKNPFKPFELRVSADRSFPDRKRGNAMSVLFAGIKDWIEKQPNGLNGRRLGTSYKRDILWLTSDDDALTLLSVQDSSDGSHSVTKEDGLAELGVPVDLVDQLIDKMNAK